MLDKSSYYDSTSEADVTKPPIGQELYHYTGGMFRVDKSLLFHCYFFQDELSCLIDDDIFLHLIENVSCSIRLDSKKTAITAIGLHAAFQV